MHIGHKLKYLIESKGYSKRDFAYQVKTTEQNLHKILNKPSVQVSQLLDFCRLLKVHPSIFFEDVEIGIIANEDSVTYTIPKDFSKQNMEPTVISLYQDLIREKDQRIQELTEHIELLKKKGS